MSLVFEWDPKKAEENLAKHGTSFNEAAEVFHDPLAASVEDTTSTDERRFILVGQTPKRKILLVVYIERGDKIRLISARNATRQEVRIYEEGNQ
jgi:uncharacterized protein